MKTNKKPIRQITDENTIEAVRNLSRDVSSDIKDVGSGVVKELWDNLLLSKKGGDLTEGQEIDLGAQGKTEKPKAETPINYFKDVVRVEKKIHEENQTELREQIEQIQIEIRKLIQGTKELQVEFKEITVEQNIQNPGKYHKTFYEWFLSTLKNWRQNVEDAGAWLSALKSKKKSRNYWSMFKKHGTSFGLSGERTVSTQVG